LSGIFCCKKFSPVFFYFLVCSLLSPAICLKGFSLMLFVYLFGKLYLGMGLFQWFSLDYSKPLLLIRVLFPLRKYLLLTSPLAVVWYFLLEIHNCSFCLSLRSSIYSPFSSSFFNILFWDSLKTAAFSLYLYGDFRSILALLLFIILFKVAYLHWVQSSVSQRPHIFESWEFQRRLYKFLLLPILKVVEVFLSSKWIRYLLPCT
jgi:hypothetical protein